LANKYYQILLAYTLVIPWLSLDRFPQQENGRCSVPQGQWPFTHCADVPSRMYSLTHSALFTHRYNTDHYSLEMWQESVSAYHQKQIRLETTNKQTMAQLSVKTYTMS